MIEERMRYRVLVRVGDNRSPDMITDLLEIDADGMSLRTVGSEAHTEHVMVFHRMVEDSPVEVAVVRNWFNVQVDPTSIPVFDYRDLLLKYLAYVGHVEGPDLLAVRGVSPDWMSAAERAELTRLAAEVANSMIPADQQL